MYKVLRIGDKDYKFEFTMEAALFGECTETATTIIEEIAEASSGVNTKLSQDKLAEELRKRMEQYIKTISNLPQKVLILFYAGLLEHHGVHPNGDGSVRNEQDAKEILRMYLKEHKGQDDGDFFGVLKMILDQMGEDGFFDLTGLNKAFQTEKKQPKQPQDHKKKSIKASEN